ncbi:hypothetical protein AMK16_21045 [Streptomyces sp. CB00455]|uniref:hypothetical protein n=1 Tax=Streptomyces sp. CB00455 TaxID=1703927 RepID=UPI00093907F4|nr:hypothetical protein [Streptomyces sp. CB00455]OKK17344.1 hypothetical protein AMK16_21045 [Streptomyces sp. CB00455]
MSQPADKTRRIITGKDSSGPVPVEYRFSHAPNGNRHLVVVFANLNAPDEYGMGGGILDDVQANVLWIRDLFDGANSYYLCKGMDFSVERSVAGLIARVMTSLALTPDDCTMFGSSKGGTAALWFGLKYGYRNIVSSVPQFRIGTFAAASMPDAARAMMGEVTQEKVHVLDSVLPDLVRGGPNPAAHVYLISSPQDRQFGIQVEPFLALLRGYQNFNFVFNDSPLISGHDKVTTRNIPAMVGLLHLLVAGLAPRIGAVRYGYEQPGRDTAAIDAFLAQTARAGVAECAAPVVLTPGVNERIPGNQVRFTGTAPGAVRVSLWENGKFLATPDVAPDGSWEWKRDTPWSRGRHVVRLFAVDANDCDSPRSEAVFVATDHAQAPAPNPARPPAPAPGPIPVPGPMPVQPAPPVQLSVSFPAPHQQVAGPVPRFAGFAPGAVRVDFHERGGLLGSCGVAADGGWVWESPWAWPQGEHYVEAVAVGAAGNASAWSAVPFTVVPVSGMNTYTVPAHGGHRGAGY